MCIHNYTVDRLILIQRTIIINYHHLEKGRRAREHEKGREGGVLFTPDESPLSNTIRRSLCIYTLGIVLRNCEYPLTVCMCVCVCVCVCVLSLCVCVGGGGGGGGVGRYLSMNILRETQPFRQNINTT